MRTKEEIINGVQQDQDARSADKIALIELLADIRDLLVKLTDTK